MIQDKKSVLLLIKLLLLTLLIVSASVKLDGVRAAGNTPFTIAVLPDTQYYSAWYPYYFNSQTQWIEDNKVSENIVAVAHVGDVVNNPPQEYQWANARAAMDILTLPTVITPGNHDTYPDLDAETFRQYFGNPNNFQVIGEYLLISVAGFLDDMQGTYDWANSVLSEYGDLKVIIVTHSYIDGEGLKTVEGQLLWDNVIKTHSNVVMVLAGHQYEEKYVVEYGDNGNKVNVLLANYQQRLGELQAFTGGQGWMRLYQFSGNTVRVRTFTPYYNEWEKDSDSEFVFDLYTGEIPDAVYGEQSIDTPDTYRVRAYLSENTLLGASSLEVKFGGERYDSGMHSPGSRRFYSKKSGVYLIGASASFSAYPEGLRSIAIFHYSNGVRQHIAQRRVHNNGDSIGVSILVNTQYYLEEGDYLTVSIGHNAGVSLLLLGKGYTEFWMAKISD